MLRSYYSCTYRRTANQLVKLVSPRGYRVTTKLLNVSTHSSIQDTIDKLPTLDNAQYDKIIHHHHDKLLKDPKQDELDQLYDLTSELTKMIKSDPTLSSELKNQQLNLLIEKFTKFDYSTFTIASRDIADNHLSKESIIEIIKYNPGRVSSSWELFKKYNTGVEADDELQIQVFNKLIHGDKVDVREGNTKLDLSKAAKALQMYSKLNDKSLVDNATMKKMITDLIELQLSQAIPALEVPVEVVQEILNEIESLKNSDHFYLFQSITNTEGTLPASILRKCFLPISNLQLIDLRHTESYEELLKEPEFQNFKPQPNILPSDSTEKIIDQIIELNLDNNQQTRMNVLRSLGFHSQNLERALKMFDIYQTKVPQESFEINDLRSILSLIFIHECIHLNKPNLLQFAEVLIPQSPDTPSSNLASLVLFHGWFGNGEKSLDIYNKSLDLFIKPKTTPAGEHLNEALAAELASSRGKLVHSLVLTTLLGRDLELAQFIKTKCKENELLDQEYEIRVNDTFKAYGDLVENTKGDESKTREGIRGLILGEIRNLAP